MMLDQNICTRLVEFLNEHCLFFILRLLDLLITSLKTMTHQRYYFLWRVNAIAVLRWKHFAEDNIVLFSKNLVSLLSWNSKYIHWCLYGITVIIYYGHTMINLWLDSRCFGCVFLPDVTFHEHTWLIIFKFGMFLLKHVELVNARIDEFTSE